MYTVSHTRIICAQGSPKAAAFERKSNGELRMIDDSTPEWIQHKLDSLTFDQKPISHSSESKYLIY